MIYKVFEKFEKNSIEILPKYEVSNTIKKYQTKIGILITNSEITKVDILEFFELSGLY